MAQNFAPNLGGCSNSYRKLNEEIKSLKIG